MRGTWESAGSGSAGELAGAAVALAAAAGAVWLVAEFIWVIAAAVGVVLVLIVGALVWLARHGAEVATVARTPLPAPEAAPLRSRTPQALQGPQVIHYHLHLDGQAAEAVRRRAITDWREP